MLQSNIEVRANIANIGKTRALLLALLSFVAVLALTTAKVHAAPDTCTWTGAVNNNWSNSGNWSGCDNGNTPQSNDTLSFPAGTPNVALTNNDTSLNYFKVTFSGTSANFEVTGIPIRIGGLPGGVDVTGTGNTVNLTAQVSIVGGRNHNNIAVTNTVNYNSALNYSIPFTSGVALYSLFMGGGTANINGGITGSIAPGGPGSGFKSSGNGTKVVINSASTVITDGVGAENDAILECRHISCFGDAANYIQMYSGKVNIYQAGTYPNPIRHTSSYFGRSAINAYDTVTLTGSSVITDGTAFTQQTSGKTLTLSGDMLLSGASITVSGIDNTAKVVLSGVVSASGSNRTVTVANSELVVSGNNTYTGATILNSGAILKGTGVVGATTANSGSRIAIGNSPGCMTFGSLTLTSGSNYDQDINDTTACSGYDKATVNGAVGLGGATLNIVQANGFAPYIGTVMTIIDGTSLTGTFAGLADGTTVSAGNVDYRINYYGSTGEVTLTVIGGSAARTAPVMPATSSSLVTPSNNSSVRSSLADTGSSTVAIAFASTGLLVLGVLLGFRQFRRSKLSI